MYYSAHFKSVFYLILGGSRWKLETGMSKTTDSKIPNFPLDFVEDKNLASYTKRFYQFASLYFAFKLINHFSY